MSTSSCPRERRRDAAFADGRRQDRNRADVVRGTGISKTVVSLVLSGKRRLTREHIEALSKFFGVNPALSLVQMFEASLAIGPIQSVIGRLAPSPTGGLHLGHARTFLIAWLAARQAGGRVILRIEDLDATRVRAEAVSTALIDLKWLGLDWDEGSGCRWAEWAIHSVRAPVSLRRRAGASQINWTLFIPAPARAPTSHEPPVRRTPKTKGQRIRARVRDELRPMPHALGDRPFAWRFRVAKGARGVGRSLPWQRRARPVASRRRFPRGAAHARPLLSACRRDR